MDSNTMGAVVHMFINVQFPGGIRAFTDQGGLACAIPFEKEAVLIYHPSMPKEFKLAVDIFNDQGSLKIQIVKDLNFLGKDPEEVLRMLLDVGKDIQTKYGVPGILYNPFNPMVLFVTIPLAVLSRKLLKEIAGVLVSRVPSLLRGVIVAGDEVVPFFNDETIEKQSAPVAPARPTTHKPRDITVDTITDLKIILSRDLDVLDLINQL